MPQISSNFILRSKLPNFERDCFDTWNDMIAVDSAWMDEGHISYCKEKGKHYVFRSNNGALTGAARWSEWKLDSSDVETYIDSHIVIPVNTKNDLTNDLAAQLSVGRPVYVKEDHSLYYNIYDNSIPDGYPQTGTYLEGETGWFYPLRLDMSQYVTNDSLTSTLTGYVKAEDLPTIEGGVTQEDLTDYVLKSEFETTKNQAITNTNAIGEVGDRVDALEGSYVSKSDLATEKAGFDSKYATKAFALDIQAGIEEKLDDQFVKQDELDAYKAEIEEYKTTVATGAELAEHIEEFNDFKEFVDETYAKPSEISSLLNKYHPNTEFTDRWIGTEIAGNLTGMTGKEVSRESLAYSEVFDKILFGEYIPTVSDPSVTMKLKADWAGDRIIDWYNEKERTIMVEAGTTGPDGSDFIADEVIDALITYPANVDLEPNYTAGLVPSTDEQQTSIGFCKIKNEDGEWDYYRKDGNRYHVPAVLTEGEYRYHFVGFFKAGSPILNNDNELISWWNESTPVESEDYVTFYASKPVYYNTPDGMVKKPLKLWNADLMSDEFVLIPSCQLEQSFMVPRKLKAMYIWNDLLGGYGQVPMVKEKDEESVETENIVPAYFKETVEGNGYYTYKYDAITNGHRGAVKIKVEF